MGLKQIQYRELTHYGLSTSCRCSDQDVLFGLVKGEEKLSLDRIEKAEFWVQRFENRVFECWLWQGLQREQVSKRGWISIDAELIQDNIVLLIEVSKPFVAGDSKSVLAVIISFVANVKWDFNLSFFGNELFLDWDCFAV